MLNIYSLLRRRIREARYYFKLLKNFIKGEVAAHVGEKIDESCDPVVQFSSIQESRLISPSVLWSALAYLRDKRSPAYDIIIKHKIKNLEVDHLIRLCEALSSPSPMSLDKLYEYIEFYKAKRKKIKNESDYRRLLIAIIVKKLPSSQAYEALAHAGMLDKITVHQILKVLHKASVENDEAMFASVKRVYKERMTPSALVKIMYWESRVNSENTITYKSIETNFIQLNKALSKEYKQFLLILFNAIPEEKNFLDFQLEEGKLARLKRKIREEIKLENPFSFVRLNDGEGYGFPQSLPCAFDMERQELHWWGEVLAPDLREKIQEDFRRSLPQHDLVGIPSVFRFVDELSINRDYSILNNALLCRLFTLCHGYLKMYDGRACITEGQINLYLFTKEFITSLASLAQHIVFISGAKREYLQHVFSDLQQVSYIELPTHRLLKDEKFSYSEAAQPLPYVYEDYIEQIRQLAGPGVVFFISAGFIGKIFAAEVAKNGGVALDVGQTLMNIVANHVDD